MPVLDALGRPIGGSSTPTDAPLSLGGPSGLEWGYGAHGEGLVYLGKSPAGTGQNTELGKYLNWYVYNSMMMSQAGIMNGVQSPLSEIQKNITLDKGPIPIVYGEAQIGGRIFAINYNNSTRKWTIGYALCLGEIQAIDEILYDGAAAVAGVDTPEKYLGTTGQTASPFLTAAIAGYTDTLVFDMPTGVADIGVAYVVIRYKEDAYETFPRILCKIRGKKVYNYATSTTVYSTNPALHLCDLLKNPSYGHGYTIDATTALAAQNFNDALVGGETSRTSYQVISGTADTDSWVDVLRTYASCIVRLRGDTIYLLPDTTGSSVKTITTANIVAGSMQINKMDSSDLPTVVRVSYTDTSKPEWKERLSTPAKLAGVDAGTVPWRESVVSFVGVNRHSQAYREAKERLAKLWYADLQASWEMFDDALALELGDIVTVTHPYGLTAKTMRISTDPVQVSPGRWRITAIEYNAGQYSSDVVTATQPPDAVLPGGIVPGTPTSLNAEEVVYQLQTGLWASRLDITWVKPDASTVTGYTVEVTKTVGGALVWAGSTTSTAISSGPLQEGVGYTVSVKAFNSLYSGTAATSAEPALIGKNAVPAAPSSPIGSNNNGEVRLRWTASPDADVAFYEIRYYTTAQTWAAGTLLDQIGALTFSTRVPAPGSTWRFGIKSIDSVGQYSATAVEVDVAVALSTSGVTTFYAASPPTALAIGDLWFDNDAGNKLYYATSTGTGGWVVMQDAGSKTTTFFQNGIPTSLAIGDIWIDGDSTPANQMYRAASIGATTIAAGQWVLVRDSGIATAQTTADGKNTVFYQSSAPTANKVNDLWIDTTAGADQYQMKRCSALPSTWVSVRDAAIATAQATADGKNTIYYQASGSAPTGMDTNDIWIKTDDYNSQWVYNGASWVKATDGSLMVLDSVVKTASFTATAGKRYPINTTAGPFDMTLPNAPTLGDTVYFFDLKRTFYTNNLTVVRAASAEKIMGAAENMACDVQNFSGGLMYVDTTEGWVLV